MILPDDFWDRVAKVGDCWEWQGGRTSGGYGHVRDLGSDRMLYAHRVAFEMQHRPLARGEFVLHACDNPSCVRGSHLVAGSNADNMLDASAKGRHFQTKKTHCPKGHAYEGGNLVVREGRRSCRECHREKSLARYYLMKGADHASV
jgi:hypothetical protein